MNTKTVYLLVDGDNRVVGAKAFTEKETADFAASGMKMFAPADASEPEVYLLPLTLVEGDVNDFLATVGLGPKGRAANG